MQMEAVLLDTSPSGKQDTWAFLQVLLDKAPPCSQSEGPWLLHNNSWNRVPHR